jgi:hypothetical protein
VVPSRWRREPLSSADGVGPIPVVLRTRGHGAAPNAESRRPRTWRLDYKATIAQWHAEPRARWPKVAKLAESERLRTWVQDRLAGEVKLPDGTTVGPKPKAGTARTPNLAFDFDDALLQLDDALLQLADPGLELLDELTECAILGLKVDVARCAG